MTGGTGRRPFSSLGDQQLLEQTRRLAANQRGLEVHILDHLDEIDRRGLALRRGFSSLFDYAVRELRFTDAAAQRRIQTMRLCRRHGWVRAMLHSGELSVTSAAQLETAFGAAERQCRTASAHVDQERCQDLHGLPATPSVASDQDAEASGAGAGMASAAAVTESAARGRVLRPGLSGNEEATTPVVPVASHAAAQHLGAWHADALPARRESSGAAWHSPAPLRAPGVAVASSDHGPAAPLPPPASGAEPVPLPVVAPSEPRLTVALAPAPSRGDRRPELCSNPERSAGPVSAAALLHPRRQRELIEQAAGMTTRQVAGLLASAAPQVAPPRDTLRAVAPDRFTLKVSIDQECEQGLRRLKDLRSHVDPRMSWGDLVARLVREAVARHDPRVGGGRRGRTGGTAASSRRERTSTPSVVAAPAPSPNAAPVRGVAPAAAVRGARAVGTRAGAAASATPAVAAAPEGQSAGGSPADGPDAAPILPITAAAPKLVSGGPADGGDTARIQPVTIVAPKLASGVPPARGAGGTPWGASPQCTRDAPLGPRRPPPRRPIPAAVRRHVWLRDGGRCCYRDPLSGRRCNSSHLLQIHHLLPVAEGGGPEPDNLALACLAHHRMCHGYGPAPPSEPSR